MKIVGGSDTVKPPSQQAREARRRGVVLEGWIKEQTQLAMRMEGLTSSLAGVCEFAPDRGIGTYVLTFRFEGAITTIGVGFADEQSGADMVITTMTTLSDETKPDVNVTRQGFGSSALQTLLKWALKQGLHNIRAVQVQAPHEKFWRDNGFVPLKNVTNDFHYIRPAE